METILINQTIAPGLSCRRTVTFRSMTMASVELDPMFRRGLKLLHSRSRDSTDQLKALLDEVIRQRQGKGGPPTKDPFSLRRESPIPRTKQGSPIPLGVNKREEAKKELERKLREEDVVAPKRPRLDSPNTFKSHTPSPTPSSKSEGSSLSRKSDESDSDADMDDIAMEIMDGINCTVCKSFEVSSRNQLVECQECHSLYHQECHKPPLTDQDVNDPRLVWYCNKCVRNMKKQGGIVPSAGGVNGSKSISGGGLSSLGGKPGASMNRPAPSPTKGLGISRPSPFANLSSVSGKGFGSSSGGNNSSTSKSSSLVSGGKPTSSSAPNSAANSLKSAEKRMQMMKKKAAAKMAEKRKF
ncbi:integrator complex subunit 12-like isoform X2 [Oratosquilla oratoria]|uniref:integrator complex subunit 12-like isoform X2 n=1 Tax=Oratosquilla oratoria TaxID=337810 RepID=UPI003F769F17